MAQYDFIVVGAGSAGCAVAEGLSRSGKYSVLLVEAGKQDRNLWIKVPIGYAFNFQNKKLNWNYHTEPDDGLHGRSIYWPRGRVIGGSSSINAMAYMRGLPVDYDGWAQSGATGWAWSDVEPAFAKMEKRIAEHTDNPVCVSDLSDQMNPFSKTFLTAATHMGWPIDDDPSPLTCEGIGFYQSTVKNGFRFSAADAFLRPALKRSNVSCVANAIVERVVISNGRAKGIEYRVGAQTFRARANSEIVLCAGAVNSPKLLMLSGVGPADQIKDKGIKLIHDQPNVGQNLQDHLAINYQFRAKSPTLNNILGQIAPRVFEAAKYVVRRNGALSVPVNQVGGYVKSDQSLDWPDMQIYCNPMSYSIGPNGKLKVDGQPGYLLSAQQCRPQSRGQIRLVSSDPNTAPKILPHSLSSDADQTAAIKAVSIIRKIADVRPLRDVTTAPIDRLPETDAQALDDFRKRASTVFHPTSTCRMGTDPRTSVIDPRCRVHGVRGLRVIDASVFPSVTSGNTNGPTMMVAMRATEMMLADQI